MIYLFQAIKINCIQFDVLTGEYDVHRDYVTIESFISSNIVHT